MVSTIPSHDLAQKILQISINFLCFLLELTQLSHNFRDRAVGFGVRGCGCSSWTPAKKIVAEMNAVVSATPHAGDHYRSTPSRSDMIESNNLAFILLAPIFEDTLGGSDGHEYISVCLRVNIVSFPLRPQIRQCASRAAKRAQQMGSRGPDPFDVLSFLPHLFA